MGHGVEISAFMIMLFSSSALVDVGTIARLSVMSWPASSPEKVMNLK